METLSDVTINITYGGALFSSLFNNMSVWDEICSYLLRNKQERSNEILVIPDFDTSPEMLIALKQLKANAPALFRKLTSSKPEYIQLRKELFPTNHNLSQV